MMNSLSPQMDKSREIWAMCELIYFSIHFAPYSKNKCVPTL